MHGEQLLIKLLDHPEELPGSETTLVTRKVIYYQMAQWFFKYSAFVKSASVISSRMAGDSLQLTSDMHSPLTLSRNPGKLAAALMTIIQQERPSLRFMWAPMQLACRAACRNSSAQD